MNTRKTIALIALFAQVTLSSSTQALAIEAGTIDVHVFAGSDALASGEQALANIRGDAAKALYLMMSQVPGHYSTRGSPTCIRKTQGFLCQYTPSMPADFQYVCAFAVSADGQVTNGYASTTGPSVACPF